MFQELLEIWNHGFNPLGWLFSFQGDIYKNILKQVAFRHFTLVLQFQKSNQKCWYGHVVTVIKLVFCLVVCLSLFDFTYLFSKMLLLCTKDFYLNRILIRKTGTSKNSANYLIIENIRNCHPDDEFVNSFCSGKSSWCKSITNFHKFSLLRIDSVKSNHWFSSLCDRIIEC